MSLNFDLVGVDSEPAERAWTESDVLLYALGVGAGQADPLAELEGRFTRPVIPGDELTISVWADGGTAYFRTTSNGAPLLDRGRLTYTR
jgi:hypothetical protein